MNSKLKIISGGQTGTDRAALDFAFKTGLQGGGYCPKGRLAEDGPLSEKYPLLETLTDNPEERTVKNINVSDGTLILHNGILDRGTAFTIRQCVLLEKPFLELDLSEPFNFTKTIIWLTENKIKALNIAGPRESNAPGIYEVSMKFLVILHRRMEKL